MANSKSNKVLLIKLGAHIKHVRESKGLSQQQFADICEFEKSTISRIERGAANTTISTLATIAKHLDVELWELFKI